MYNSLISIPIWIAAVMVAAYFAVLGFDRRKPADRMNKFIPAIVCLVFAINLTYIIIYGGDIVFTNIFMIFLVVFLEFLSVAGLLGTLLTAGMLELRERRKVNREGVNPDEKA